MPPTVLDDSPRVPPSQRSCPNRGRSTGQTVPPVAYSARRRVQQGTDWQPLNDFGEPGNEAAFATLLSRHGPMGPVGLLPCAKPPPDQPRPRGTTPPGVHLGEVGFARTGYPRTYTQSS